MASPAEPVTTEPTGALYQALSSPDVDPQVAYKPPLGNPVSERPQRQCRCRPRSQDRRPRCPDRG